MKLRLFCVAGLLFVVTAGSASAANFVIINGDVPGEGLNDTTPVSPVGGNTGTTLGEQRLIVLEAVANQWAERIESPVDIVIMARFNPMDCGVLGSTGPGAAFMNFPGAPVPNVLFHSAIADSITGVDQNPGVADFFITYNSSWDGVTCGSAFYYGLDGNEPVGTEDLYPVVLHEMGHGLGFASFASPSSGAWFYGAPGIFDYYILDMTSGLHWTDMNSSQRAASATNTMQLAWDGPNSIEGVGDILFPGPVEFEVASPPAVAGPYDNLRGQFGGSVVDELEGDFELVDTGAANPTFGCDPLVGFTPGNVAFIERGDCEFGLKALNAENAGASAVIIANDRDGDVIVNMAGGDDGGAVTIPVIAIGQDDGTAIKAELPGVSGSMGLWRPMLYAPASVNPGSSVSHWDDLAEPDLLMEPFTSPDIFDELDLTPAQLRDVGHTVNGFEEIFADGFESGDTTSWDNTTP
jgi:hypothetical protein